MIKKAIAFVIVLALLLVGYFLMTTQEDDVLMNIGNSFGMPEDSILGEILIINEDSIVILDLSSEEGFSSNGQLNEIEISINTETKLVKIPLSAWLYGESTEQNEIPIDLENLGIRSLIVPYVDGEQMTDNSLVATKIVLLDFNEE